MTSYHAWKRRLWGPEYPIENGPPYRDPATGAPILPGGIQGGPYQGVDDDGPNTGNPVILGFIGPATGPGEVVVLIDDQTASAPSGGRWVGCSFVFDAGATANQIATGIAADFNARSWEGWTDAVAATNTVTFTPQAAGSATGYVVYSPSRSGTSKVATPTPISEVTISTTSLPPEGAPAGSTAEVDFKANGSAKSTTHVPADRPKVETIAALEAELVAMPSVQIVLANEDQMTLVGADGYVLSDGTFFVIPPEGD